MKVDKIKKNLVTRNFKDKNLNDRMTTQSHIESDIITELFIIQCLSNQGIEFNGLGLSKVFDKGK